MCIRDGIKGSGTWTNDESQLLIRRANENSSNCSSIAKLSKLLAPMMNRSCTSIKGQLKILKWQPASTDPDNHHIQTVDSALDHTHDTSLPTDLSTFDEAIQNSMKEMKSDKWNVRQLIRKLNLVGIDQTMH